MTEKPKDMKYWVKENIDNSGSSYVLMRGDEVALPNGGSVNNAELEFWFKIESQKAYIEKLEKEIKELKQYKPTDTEQLTCPKCKSKSSLIAQPVYYGSDSKYFVCCRYCHVDVVVGKIVIE